MTTKQKTILTEGLRYLDMKDQVYPTLGIDQYASSVGTDDDLITLDFTVKAKEVAADLAEWFERGYDCVVDAEPSPGEVTAGKFLVFVEMNRRLSGPKQIIEMLDDLQTLTGFKVEDWKIKIGDQTEQADINFIKSNVEMSPHEYRMSKDTTAQDDAQLNEWRRIAGVNTVSTYTEDEAIKAIKRQAGIY